MYLAPRITAEPGKLGGKPCIRGLRFSVRDLLERLAGGGTAETLLAEYPDLEAEDIPAALTYAASQVGHPVVLADARSAELSDDEVDQLYREASEDEEAEREALEWIGADLGDALPDEDWEWLRDAQRRGLVGGVRPGDRGRDPKDPASRDRLERPGEPAPEPGSSRAAHQQRESGSALGGRRPARRSVAKGAG